jgi:hypothetical protein
MATTASHRLIHSKGANQLARCITATTANQQMPHGEKRRYADLRWCKILPK